MWSFAGRLLVGCWSVRCRFVGRICVITVGKYRNLLLERSLILGDVNPIPRTNVINLMLTSEVIDAVEQGIFHIYAVEDIDQSIELLMGLTAGKINSAGRYPRKSVHGIALDKLSAFADMVEGVED